MNEQWKNAYREGFADGYAAAKKDTNYVNFPPVYYDVARGAADSSTRAGSVPTGGMSYSINQPADHFVTGMTVSESDC